MRRMTEKETETSEQSDTDADEEDKIPDSPQPTVPPSLKFPTESELKALATCLETQQHLQRFKVILCVLYNAPVKFLDPFLENWTPGPSVELIDILAHCQYSDHFEKIATYLLKSNVKKEILDGRTILDRDYVPSQSVRDSDLDSKADEELSDILDNDENDALYLSDAGYCEGRGSGSLGLGFDPTKSLEILREHESSTTSRILFCEIVNDATAEEVVNILTQTKSLLRLTIFFPEELYKSWCTISKERIRDLFVAIKNSRTLRQLSIPSICVVDNSFLDVLRLNSSIAKMEFSDYGGALKFKYDLLRLLKEIMSNLDSRLTTIRIYLPNSNYFFSPDLVKISVSRTDGLTLKLFQERRLMRYARFLRSVVLNVWNLWLKGDSTVNRIVLDEVDQKHCDFIFEGMKEQYGDAMTLGFVGWEYCCYGDPTKFDSQIKPMEESESESESEDEGFPSVGFYVYY
ncbi:hypothetical protein HK098_004794 [Nowakowskiella sp. JEL0407]|nr:hypothetical protein HK098_004794 [Nowakowskiella sp. JEL0407]